MTLMTSDELRDLLIEGLSASGFSARNAEALASQMVLAEEMGQRSTGLSHVFDYLNGLAEGRIDGKAEPEISELAPAILLVDGQAGIPQLGFDDAFERLLEKARTQGLALFLQNNATLCGSLGTFALRLAEAGLVSLAATSGSPILAGSGAREPVFCTNPLAFAAPQADAPPLLVDQASSATAYVNIREAAERGECIPEGWALDRSGEPTSDPQAALSGTLLPFGGMRGGNIALMVEILAAGLSGANWALDAPSFFSGDRTPGAGLFVLAIDPTKVDPDFPARMAQQVSRLNANYGVHIPGRAKAEARKVAEACGIEVEQGLIDRLLALVEN